MGASFLWPRTTDPMRRIGVGIFFGMCGTFFQSLTEWVFHQTPIFFTFNILLGVLASLCLHQEMRAARPAKKPSWNSRSAKNEAYWSAHIGVGGKLLICAPFTFSENTIRRSGAAPRPPFSDCSPGFVEHEVESVVYCPSIKRTVEKDPLAAAGHRIERFHAFAPIVGISSQRRRQIVSVGGNLMSLDLAAAAPAREGCCRHPYARAGTHRRHRPARGPVAQCCRW